MEKARLEKFYAIARLNLMDVSFQEQEDGTVIATSRGVSFVVTTYRNFDLKLKEIKRMPPQKRSLFSRLLNRGKVS